MTSSEVSGFNLDSLLDDINQATAEPATLKFYPRRPSKERSPNQVNPKARFAVMPDSAAGAVAPPPLSPVETFSYSGTSSPVSCQSPNPSPISAHRYNSQGGAAGRSAQDHKLSIPDSASKTRLEISSPDDMSIDNILDMLASPRSENKKPAPVASTKSSSDDYHSSHKTGIFERYGPGYGSESKDGSGSTSLPSAIRGNGLQTMSPSSSASAQSNSTTFASSERSGVSFPSTSSRLSASVAASSSGSYSSGPSGSSSLLSNSATSLGSSSFPSSVSGAGGTKRCTRVVIAGASHTRGIKSSAFSKCACDNLRCLQCNFKVHQFANRRWSSDGVDYMFFRNNVPNEGKLETKLLRCEDGNFAYCCQCSWADALAERAVVPNGVAADPQWVCAGHA